ncbi:MAG: DNRLRE domain-containing protein, partial [Oscillospiraceae bacterium]|nr:DNRLRE domain-containing protein [Oscillospiraceae bacterium]
MKNRFFQLLSIILVFVMLFNMFPLQVFAEEQQKATADVSVSDTVPKDVRIAEEKIHKRTEYSKEFHLNNGLSMAVVYPEAVHYQDGGQWKEIDNTLQLSTDGTYTNAAGLWDVRFPQQLTSSNGISITKDGYTLSFAMAGEIVNKGLFAKAGDSETLTVSGAQASTARVETVDNTEMKNAAEYPETVPDKLKSRLTYSGVYQNTNVIYDLDSNKVKESIVLSRYNSALSGYRYTLQVGSLIPVLEESGQILFFTPDKKDVVMVMPAPYLVDADNVYNTDVQVTLTGSGSTYTLTYTLPKTWLAAQDRAWPVVLDPMVTPTMSTSNIKDRTVAENVTYSAGSGILECGYSTQYGVERIYLQYAGLPALTGSQTVVSASIQMYKVLDSAVEIPVEVHKVNAAWDSNTITWANKPGYNSIVEDYKLVKNEGFYAWEITNIVRGWYENGNTGMMFKAPNSAEQAGTNNWKQFYSSDYSDYHNLKPLLVITFRDNKGIEPYYSYQTLSAGLSGTAYVADATGQLKVTKQVASYHSEVNPFQLNLVYNSDYFAQNANANDPIQSTHNIDMYFGKGFTLDMIQTVEPAGLENALYTYLVYHDGDGTDHYFRKQDDGTYLDEDGLGLTITVSQSDYIMTDDQGNTWKFTDGI